MRYHYRFSEKQIEGFDRAWQIFSWAAIAAFALIVASPMIKAALTGTPLAWAVVPGFMALAGGAFFIVMMIASDIRSQIHAPWTGVLSSYAWFECVQQQFDDRLVRKQMLPALARDLDRLKTANPGLEPALTRFASHPDGVLNLRKRDIAALRSAMRRRGLACETWQLDTAEATRLRRAHVEKAVRRLNVDWEQQLDDWEAEEAARIQAN